MTEDQPNIYVKTPWGPMRSLLAPEHLQAMARQIDEKYPTAPAPEDLVPPEFVPTYKVLLLSQIFLRKFFGEAWVSRWALPTTSPPKGDYLRRDITALNEFHMHLMRVKSLGEMIFNLQRVSGLDEVLERLRGGDVESAIAELEAGMMLQMAGVAFRYVKRIQQTGFDYDIELFHPNGVLCCVEAKCRIEAANFNLRAVGKRLREATNQLPQLRPGILMIKIPQGWTTEPGFYDKFENMVRGFLNETKRIVLVHGFTVSSAVVNDRLVIRPLGRDYVNKKHRFDPRINWILFRFPLAPMEHCWINFFSLFPEVKRLRGP